MKLIEGGVCAAKGFTANGIHCGIRKNRTKRDLALIYSEKKAAAAGAGTALAISARSRLLWFLRMPQWTPFAVKPFAAHTPPGIVFMKNPSV